MIVSAYSERLYKNKLNNSKLEEMVVECNGIKIALYSLIVRKKLSLKELNTTYIISKYGVNTFYANMIIEKVRAILSGQEELQLIYIENLKASI